jgi:DNA-binding NarL/FixJ family response regulator
MKTNHRHAMPVLIVDDSAILRERLGALIQECGSLTLVGEAGSVAEAWALFQRCQPQAVVLDVKVGQGSGLDLLRRIKQASPGCVVLVLTNYTDLEFEQACRGLGADFFLEKAGEFQRAADTLCRLAGQWPRTRSDDLRTAKTPSLVHSPDTPGHLGKTIGPQTNQTVIL